ncbi:MAG: PmoA family protein [Bacteroidales bacterium]|nr:PmoA family protein [Bacteroidales bacterium]
MNKVYVFIIPVFLWYLFDSKQVVGFTDKPFIEIKNNSNDFRLDIYFDKSLFTSYNYSTDFAKPFFYPVVSPAGNIITRRFPLEAKGGERADHPHQVGCWFNFGDVNGIDFWNNSDSIPADLKSRYGEIKHVSFESVHSGVGQAGFTQNLNWQSHQGEILMREKTVFTISGTYDTRMIGRVTTLYARSEKVVIRDNKEGLFAIRLSREFEMPDNKPLILTDENGRPKKEKEINNDGVQGHYIGSSGITGKEIWGTRNKWVVLSSSQQQDPVSVAICDHPDNINFPSYWMARDYGLFAIDNFGMKAFNEKEPPFAFVLEKGDSLTLKYVLIIKSDGHLSSAEMDKYYQDFITQN